MLGRAALLCLLLVGLSTIVWRHPPPLPTPPEHERWQKVDVRGQILPAWGGPWQCVLDRHRGLMWEVKSVAEDLHDQQCSFSWFDGRTGTQQGGDCFGAEQASDTQELIDYANATRRCASRDWRLPTAAELSTLLIDHPQPGAPIIALDYFPFTQSGPYWTADAQQPLQGFFARLGDGAVAINFKHGDIQRLPYANAAFVRLVTDTPNVR